MDLLERCIDENVETINDMSEEIRQEIDNIYDAIAALTLKDSNRMKPEGSKIGFKTSTNQ